ncbi:Na(+) H(+) antiporter subunit D [Vibrio maritimus]|uniref:Na(+) H(+) antiporter subunit D n=1 Tax=Vibrio maritimus TaxID=990268 RepID=A0A090TR46_9VIBR|nr:Na(+) H(+) antiporter subunit D [Vibrio maritimus]
MIELVLTLPVVISLLTAVLVFFVRSCSSWVDRISGISAVGTLLVCVGLLVAIVNSEPQAVAFGQWAAPFGIVFVADYLSAAMVLVTAIIGGVCVFYAMADLASKHHMVFIML